MIDTEVARVFDRRAALFLTGGAVLTSILVMRMLQMQVFSYQTYKRKSENNSFRIQMNVPERGKIMSAGGTAISRDAPIYRIYIIPEEADNVDELIQTVATELNLSAAFSPRLKSNRNFNPHWSVKIWIGKPWPSYRQKICRGCTFGRGLPGFMNWGRPAPRFSDMSAHLINRLPARRSLPLVSRDWNGGLMTRCRGCRVKP